MSEPILPLRPLRLRWSFTAGAIVRAIVALAPALSVIAAACVWQARAAWEVADDQRGWERGFDVELLDSSREERVVFGVVHDVVVRVRYLDRVGTERGGAMRWLTVIDPGTSGPLSARVDPVRERMVLSWAAGAAPWRWAWVGLAALVLLGLLAGCVLATRALLREYLVARRAARASGEVELEVVELVTHDVHGKPSVLEVRYRAPHASEVSVGYRDSASGASDEVLCERFRLADGGPILLDDGARVLALQPRGGSRVTLVRDDLWPFAISAEHAREARARIASRQPPPSPASSGEPASAMGMQAPSSSNT